MSLFVLPVTVADLTGLQQSLTFKTNLAEATAEATAINPPNETDTVAAYAQRLLDSNISFSQVAMAVPSLMFNATPTTATLANITNVFLPPQVSLAVALHLDPTVYAAEATGLALSNGAAFATNFGSLSVTDFALKVSGLTGVNTGAIVGFLQFWEGFYAKNTAAIPPGSTIDLAAKGAALGDAVGNALVAHLPFQDTVENALLTIATGQYVAGVPINTLPEHIPLQGEFSLRLTVDVDHLTAQFAGAVFDGSPAGNPPLGVTNTLNIGDVLVDTVGDGTLNYTAVHNFFGANDPFAQNVTMDGISDVNILNLADGGELAGFAGDVTGLLTLTIKGGSTADGDVQVGNIGQGLNTALETVNIEGGIDGGDVNVWVESSAFAGGEVLQVNLEGVTTFSDFNVTGGPDFYAEIDVNSAGSANEIDLDTNASTVATVVATGDQDLTLHGSVLDVGNLDLFDGSAATGDLTIGDFFGTGDVQALGGSGNDQFFFFTDGAVDVQGNDGDDTFTFFTPFFDGPTFTADDSADGGAGTNVLQIESYHGALLGAGVGPNITNIQTIEHITFDTVVGDISVDMSRSGSATILDLQGDYGYVPGSPPFVNPDVEGFNVTVTELTNVDNVVYTGAENPFFGSNGINTLTLEHAGGVGVINFTMDQTLDGGTMSVGVLDIATPTTLLVLDSIGNADLNYITDATEIDTDVQITGNVDLNLVDAAGQDFNFKNYDFAGGIIDASLFTGDLGVGIGDNSQTVFGGTGNDYIEVATADAPDLIHLDAGGADVVEFEEAFSGNDSPVDNSNYTLVTGFSNDDDTILIDVTNTDMQNLSNTATGNTVQPGDSTLPLVYSTNTDFDANVAPGFNFILVFNPVNSLAGQDAQDGFEQAMGNTGVIHVDGGTEDVLFAYFDATHQQMVLGFVDDVDTASNNEITNDDDFDVIALISMSKAEYDAFGANQINFVD